MSSEFHVRVSELFLAACELEGDERAEFLDGECRGDASLRARVEALLRQDERVGAELPTGGEQTRIGCLLPALAQVLTRATRPERIGRYRVLDALGEGGMGIVYRAEQDNPRREVALKVVQAGLLSAETLQRFEHESALLGRLQHPNIAQIFEAGVALDQVPRPYFAMELVEGQTLAAYVRERRPDVATRVRLLVKVCAGVHHAHQKGIVHRDLKPGNVLVNALGEPKVLDFGVAKVIDADVPFATRRTQVGQIVGTLAYMSPEQAAGVSDEIDIRSDVYSLGVMLYELLVGRLPFALRERSIAVAVRMIQEQEPPRLRAFDRSVPADLETIVLKAMAKERARRYESVTELAGDLERFLRHEPILARPATASYHLRKFVRRNTVLIAGAVATLGALLLGFVLFAWQYRVASQALVAEAREKARAETEASCAKEAVDFLEGMLISADPERENGRNLTVREAVDRAAATVGERLKGKPLVEAAVRSAIGHSYVALEQFAAAEEELERALALQLELLGPHDLAVARTKGRFGNLHAARGEYAEAETVYREAQAIFAENLGEDALEVDDMRTSVASVAVLRGEHERGIDELRAVAAGIALREGEEAARTLSAQMGLAQALLYGGETREGEALLRRVLAHLPPGDSADHYLASRSLAEALCRQRRFDEARSLAAAAVEEARRVWSLDHSYVALAQQCLGQIASWQGRFTEAEVQLREAYDLLHRRFPDGGPRVAKCSSDLGYTLIKLGRFDEAEEKLRDARDWLEALDSPPADQIAAVLENLVFLYRTWRRPELAASCQEELRTLHEEIH